MAWRGVPMDESGEGGLLDLQLGPAPPDSTSMSKEVIATLLTLARAFGNDWFGDGDTVQEEMVVAILDQLDLEAMRPSHCHNQS